MTRPTSVGEQLAEFGAEMAHTRPPYSKRNWGHPLHALCSYQGKLKPGLAHTLIETLTASDATVLDPLGGVGTIALEAALNGRLAWSNDLSPLAFIVARAKVDPPAVSDFDAALTEFGEELRASPITNADRRDAEFGLNARVADYFHASTLDDILRARKLLRAERDLSRERAFICACLLHVLHGNRPYALSRTSHPITPFSPRGPFIAKDIVESVRAKGHRALSESLPATFRLGDSLQGDYRTLPERLPRAVDAIITSPPFIGMRFDRPNWLRLWFCGWVQQDFHDSLSAGFLERQQVNDRECYGDFFRVCAEVLEPDGVLVIHAGAGPKGDLAGDLRRLAADMFRLEADVEENVSGLERHGLSDKRLTIRHHVLAFTRR
jgi:Putative RNA methylase family UPF0020